MDSSRQKQNLDCSILFMQQEHAQTLKGLHSEIEKLQKRCSELTFQLAMENTHVSQEDVFREKCEQLEKENTARGRQISELEGVVEKRDKKVAMLEQQLRAQERKYTDELKTKKQVISSMSKELDTKAGTVARLMTELHTMKVKLKAFKHGGKEEAVPPDSEARSSLGSAGSLRSARSAGSSSTKSDDISPESPHMQPLPPKDAPPKSRRRHSGRRSTLEPSNTHISSVKHRAPSSRKLSAGSDNSDLIPDPTPFLLLQKETSATSLSCSSLSQGSKAPLPPIAARSGRDKHAGDAVLPQSADSLKFVHHVHPSAGNSSGSRESGSSPEVEVETLAVDQVAKRTHSLRRAHEYRSSDY